MALNSIREGRNVYESSGGHRPLLLNEARLDAEGNLTAALDLATDAAGAEEVEMSRWDVECFVRGQHRSISGFDATVYLDGLQARDGAVSWSLSVRVEDQQSMFADEVRDLAAKLIEAADELEHLAEIAPAPASQKCVRPVPPLQRWAEHRYPAVSVASSEKFTPLEFRGDHGR